MQELDDRSGRGGESGKWMALAAALLGWMFDGVEIGLFPLVARPALLDLLGPVDDREIGKWIGVATACFLIGAATGGVLFGWLGDRLGRVRAMMLSVVTYAIFSGLCGVATSAEQVAVFRFLSALGMGGEWSLGVALVMEIWPNRSRAFLAGLIGAASNVGFLLIALVGLSLAGTIQSLRDLLLAAGMPESWVVRLVAHEGWRLLMLVGALPAVLAFFIQVFVPESRRWQAEQQRGRTSQWATQDLLGVLIGAGSGVTIIYLWAVALPLGVRIAGTVLALAVTTVGFLYPVIRYLQRSQSASPATPFELGTTIRRMLLGACLSGVALLGTWGSLQWAPAWADKLVEDQPLVRPTAKAYTQIASSIGAIAGTMLAALAGDWFGRRISYALLCVLSLASALFLFYGNTAFGTQFLFSVFAAGMFTASFYGWLPLYLPELFRTAVRATGQGFSYNFGRTLAAIGTLQTGYLIRNVFENSYPKACAVISLVYVIGFILIWFAPETHGQPLPE